MSSIFNQQQQNVVMVELPFVIDWKFGTIRNSVILDTKSRTCKLQMSVKSGRTTDLYGAGAVIGTRINIILSNVMKNDTDTVSLANSSGYRATKQDSVYLGNDRTIVTKDMVSDDNVSVEFGGNNRYFEANELPVSIDDPLVVAVLNWVEKSLDDETINQIESGKCIVWGNSGYAKKNKNPMSFAKRKKLMSNSSEGKDELPNDATKTTAKK